MMPENKGLSKLRKFQFFSFLFIFTLFSPLRSLANHPDTYAHSAENDSMHAMEHAAHEAAHETGFNPGKMILDDVKVAHDWHIMDINGHAVSVPLPVILYDNGLHMFMSSKFEHGHAVVESNGNYYALHEGHVYKTNADGHLEMGEKGKVLNEAPLDFSITKNVLSLLLGACIILWIFLTVANSYKKRGNSAPKGLQSLI